jgi:hypothetical protein
VTGIAEKEDNREKYETSMAGVPREMLLRVARTLGKPPIVIKRMSS